MSRSTALSLSTFALLTAALAGPAAAETLAADPMVGEAGSLNADLPSPGFLGAWTGRGIAYAAGGGGLTGAGSASRNLGLTVDFDRDGEYFLRTSVGRSGLGGAGNYASIGLFTNDDAVQNRPLKLGYSSGNTLLVSLGTERADVKPARAGITATGPITIAARLVTRPAAEGPDRMEVWAWPAGETGPRRCRLSPTAWWRPTTPAAPTRCGSTPAPPPATQRRSARPASPPTGRGCSTRLTTRASPRRGSTRTASSRTSASPPTRPSRCRCSGPACR